MGALAVARLGDNRIAATANERVDAGGVFGRSVPRERETVVPQPPAREKLVVRYRKALGRADGTDGSGLRANRARLPRKHRQYRLHPRQDRVDPLRAANANEPIEEGGIGGGGRNIGLVNRVESERSRTDAGANDAAGEIAESKRLENPLADVAAHAQ